MDLREGRQFWTSAANGVEKSTDQKGRTLDPRLPIRLRPVNYKSTARKGTPKKGKIIKTKEISDLMGME